MLLEEIYQRLGGVEVTLGRHEERISDLELYRDNDKRWKEKIENKLNGIGWGIAATLGGVVVDLLLRLSGR